MGRGKHLTIDEWFYHWFADEEKLPLVSTLFEQIFIVCDMLVVHKGSRLAHKFFELVNASSMYPPRQREEVKEIVRKFITNRRKVFFIDDVPDLPEEVIPLLPRKDLYIVQMCLASVDKIVITSNTTLHQNLLETFERLSFTVYMVEDFMNRYPEI